MNPTFFDDDMTDGNSKDADALDRALDAMIRGDRRKAKRLDPGMRETVDRMFALADVSGMSPAGAVRVSPASLLQWRNRVQFKQVVSALSAVAAIVVLAIAINAAVPGFPSGNGSYGTMVPTSDASSDSFIHVAPLSMADCDVAPRTRAELRGILSTTPSDADLPEGTPSEIKIDQDWIDALNDTLRTWQACARYNNSFAAMALESSGFIRRTIYPDLYAIDPYSETTIDEILDGYLRTDEVYSRQITEEGYVDRWSVLVIDQTKPIDVSKDEQRIDAHVRLVSPITGESHDAGMIMFAFEDGGYRIGLTERDLLTGSRYPTEHFIKE
jgi:hypothetical protein